MALYLPWQAGNLSVYFYCLYNCIVCLLDKYILLLRRSRLASLLAWAIHASLVHLSFSNMLTSNLVLAHHGHMTVEYFSPRALSVWQNDEPAVALPDCTRSAIRGQRCWPFLWFAGDRCHCSDQTCSAVAARRSHFGGDGGVDISTGVASVPWRQPAKTSFCTWNYVLLHCTPFIL